jgi:membrane-associated phospholipid phosphatase
MESELKRPVATRAQFGSVWRNPIVWIGLLVSLLALIAFFGIADIVFQQRPLLQIDTRVALYLMPRVTPFGTRVMEFVSGLAVPGALLLGIAGALLLAYRRRWPDLALWAVGLSGGFFLNWWLKQAYDAIRPPIADPLRLAFEWGFPSGHALAALVAYGLIGVLLWGHIARRGWRIALALGLAALILLIGFSRLYVEDHYLGDVLAGYAVGLSWLALCVSMWAGYRALRTKNQEPRTKNRVPSG